jgi:hypothetical protein
MIYYHGYPIGKNLGDDACFLSFVFSLKHEYRKLITLIPSEKCRIAVLGGGSLITNQIQCGFSEYKKIVKKYKMSTFVFGTGFDYIPEEGDKDWSDEIKRTFYEKDVFWRGILTREKMGGYGFISGDPALNKSILLSGLKYKEYGTFEVGLSYGDSPGEYNEHFFKEEFSNIDQSKMVLVPVCQDDRLIMRKHFPKAFCLERVGWSEYVSFIKEHVDHMHSMKLHSTIASYLSGKKYTSYNYRLKCKDFEKSKNEIDIDILVKNLNKKVEELL